MIILALKAGLRQGELLALRWEDIDLVDGLLRVRRSVTRGIVTDAEEREGAGDPARGRGDRGAQGASASSRAARVLRRRGADVEKDEVQASALAGVPKAGLRRDRLARPAAHVRFSPRDAWGAAQGGAGAARSRHDRDDDALRASQSRRAAGRREAARRRRPSGNRLGNRRRQLPIAK